jgi:hypothetical protein
MNRFAHSADEASVRTDANEIAALLAALSSRFAAMRSITLEVEKTEAPLMVTTAPFLLLNLLWLCLDYAMAACGPEKTITLTVEAADGAARFRFRGLEMPEPVPGDLLPAQPDDSLMQALNARMLVDDRLKELTVVLAGGGEDAAPTNRVT